LARIHAVVIIGAIVASMVVAAVLFLEYYQNIKEAHVGEQIVIGHTSYVLICEGTERGSKEIQSDRTFMKIGIRAANLKGEPVPAETSQFVLIDKGGTQTQPTHVMPVEESRRVITYYPFDGGQRAVRHIYVEGSQVIAYFPLQDEEPDEWFQYRIMIRPTLGQVSADLGFVYVTNCQDKGQ